MNERQRWIIIAMITVVVAMLLFPPFHFRGTSGVVFNLGYSFLFSPPHFGSGSSAVGTVDIGMLLTQWVGVGIVGGLAFFVARLK
jgi:hypothetical protein